jgi:hypothetical protein
LRELEIELLCPGSFVYKNANSKHQIKNKAQISILNDQNPLGKGLSGYSNLAPLNLFDIWNFNKLMNIQKSKSHLRITKAWYFEQRFLLRVYLWH